MTGARRRGFFEWPGARLVLVLIGFALSLLFVSRSQIGGDQWNLLARAWLMVDRGVWIPFGNPTSAGGNGVGSLTSLSVGAPLFVWHHFRAPALFIAVLHLIGYFAIDRVLRSTMGARGRVVFAVLYWLNPWRLYFSGHVWNPNFLFLAGAAHMWTAFGLRARAEFWRSFLHVVTIGFAFQLHPAAVVLALASAILVARGTMRLHLPGVVLGVAVLVASLVPWMLAASLAPEVVPGSQGFLGRGLIFVFPVVRGILDLVRYSSLSVAGSMTAFDFTAVLGAGVDTWLAPSLRGIALVVGVASAVPAVFAYRWFLRRQWTRRQKRALVVPASNRRWCDLYCVGCLAGALLAFLAAPTTVMYWQSFVVLHVPVLVLVRWLTLVERTPRGSVVRRGLAVTAVISILLALAMAAGARHYRCGGRQALGLVLADRYPMVRDLGIDDACPVSVDPAAGWTPDVFRGSVR